MNEILADIPQIIETERLKLVRPRAGLGPELHAAIIDAPNDYIK